MINLIINILNEEIQENKTYNGNIFELQNADNFDEYITNLSQDHYLVVKYFSPNCGHCIAIAQNYSNLAYVYTHQDKYTFEENGTQIPIHNDTIIAEADCTQVRQICRNAQITGYPTIRVYRYGELIDQLDGKRTVDRFVNFIENSIRMTEEAVQQIKEENESENNTSENNTNYNNTDDKQQKSYSWGKQKEL